MRQSPVHKWLFLNATISDGTPIQMSLGIGNITPNLIWQISCGPRIFVPNFLRGRHHHHDEVTVCRVIQFLTQQVQDNLEKHIQETVPESINLCMIGMKSNLKHVLEIGESHLDPKTKLQARAIVNDCYYKFILDRTTNASIVSDALKYILSKKQNKLIHCISWTNE